jgi:hypothetical protein
MPGTDPLEAHRIILGELPGLPHLAELPARGPGADLVGRTAALLVDMPVETTASGWRFTARPGRDQRRAASLLSADLDAAQQAAEGYRGPFKIQLCGPWTLAATIGLTSRLDPALADPGAVGDVIASLAEGVAAHRAEMARRLPGAELLVQLDEPALPAVLAGQVPTASGLNRIGAVGQAVTRDGLATVLTAAGGFRLVHCCAAEVPFGIIKDAGAQAVAFDASLLRQEAEDAFAEAAEAGLGVLIGVLPGAESRPVARADGRPAAEAAGPGSALPAGTSAEEERNGPGSLPAAREIASRAARLWRRIGLPPGEFAAQAVLTPACGLAGASPAYARAALSRCREAARIAAELMEEGSQP